MDRPFIASSGAICPSQVMRVSMPPYTSLPVSPLGRAVHLAVCKAKALVGAKASSSPAASRKTHSRRRMRLAAQGASRAAVGGFFPKVVGRSIALILI